MHNFQFHKILNLLTTPPHNVFASAARPRSPIKLAAAFDSTDMFYFGADWSFDQSQTDQRCDGLSAIDPRDIDLCWMYRLSSCGEFITGHERLDRLRRLPHALLGRRFLATFLDPDNQRRLPVGWMGACADHKALLTLDGEVLISPDKRRHLLALGCAPDAAGDLRWGYLTIPLDGYARLSLAALTLPLTAMTR